MLAYAKQILPDLLVPFDGDILEEDSSKWNQEVMNMELVQLVNNFSETRITHLQKVVSKVMATEIEKNKIRKNQPEPNYPHPQQRSTPLPGYAPTSQELRKQALQQIMTEGTKISNVLQTVKDTKKWELTQINELEKAARQLLQATQNIKKIDRRKIMAISKDFIEAVQAGKTMRVRIMLKDSLLVDPTASHFDEMSHYAESEISNLYVEHDGEALNYDVSSWNENYLNEQMVVVVNNFSKERIDLLKSMVRTLYKEKVNRIKAESHETKTTHGVSRKQIGTGVTAAGAALTVAGLCTAHTALTSGGVVVVAAGVALIVSDKGNE